jgi:hypothetical protein
MRGRRFTFIFSPPIALPLAARFYRTDASAELAWKV